MTTTWSPRRRYSAVAVFSDDLERVVLIHKLKPAWQAGKANFPGGKVEATKDYLDGFDPQYDDISHDVKCDLVYRRCAVREVAEETGLVLDIATMKLFCTLRFKSPDSDGDAECQFFCCVGDVDKVRTMESERVFVDESSSIQQGYHATYCTYRDAESTKTSEIPTKECCYLADDASIPTMSNLPWLTAMARQTLRDDGSDSTPPFVVYEAGAKDHA